MKINQAYDFGGAKLTTETVKQLFETATGKNFAINGVIDVNFNGFQRAVNYVHGVYVDVDRRYYIPPNTGTSEIDLEPGYQRLVGSDALAYVRFRHNDSDIFRAARQQDFLRQAVGQPSVQKLKSLDEASQLLGGAAVLLPLRQGLPVHQERVRDAQDRGRAVQRARAGQPDPVPRRAGLRRIRRRTRGCSCPRRTCRTSTRSS